MAKLTDYHIRGLTDSSGSPGSTIDTIAVEHHDDGSIRFTRNGRVVVLRDQHAQKLIFDALNLPILGDPSP